MRQFNIYKTMKKYLTDENLSLKEAHEIAQNIHDEIENKFEEVKHCMVHMNPKEIK